MLARMFSGSGFLVEKDEEGCYFIDRPGDSFAPILRYLQTGEFIPPSDVQKMKLIALEADFYQIHSLVDLLSYKPFTCTTNTTDGILYWLGTNRGTQPWANPHTSAVVVVTGASNPANVVGRYTDVAEAGWCNDARNKSFVVDFKQCLITPTSYSLSWSNSCHQPRHWTLDGCLSGGAWIQLHVCDSVCDTWKNFPMKFLYFLVFTLKVLKIRKLSL